MKKFITAVPSLKEMEVTFFRMLQEQFAEGMVQCLETLDKWIMQERDRNRYRLLDSREVSMSTAFGEIVFKRRMYRDREKNCIVYLLDQHLSFEGGSSVSPHFEELAVELASKGPSYRESAAKLEAFVGYPAMSHETIRERLIARAEQAAPIPQKKRKPAVLFIEADGLYTKKQRTERKRRGMENRIAVVHEGWEENGERVMLQHKKHYLHKTQEPFWEAFGDFLVDHYDIDENTWLVVNGDGATWIGECTSYLHRCIYTLDRFHVVRDLKRFLRHIPSFYKTAHQAVKAYDPEALMAVLEAVDSQALPERLRKDWQKFKGFLERHKEHLRDYRRTLKEAGMDTSTMRPMGSAESQMNVFAKRTKGGGYSWSKRGVHAMIQSVMALKEGRVIGVGSQAEIPETDQPACEIRQLLKRSNQKAQGCMNGMIRTLHTSKRSSPLGVALKGLSGLA